jgi:hypothetical protein
MVEQIWAELAAPVKPGPLPQDAREAPATAAKAAGPAPRHRPMALLLSAAVAVLIVGGVFFWMKSPGPAPAGNPPPASLPPKPSLVQEPARPQLSPSPPASKPEAPLFQTAKLEVAPKPEAVSALPALPAPPAPVIETAPPVVAFAPASAAPPLAASAPAAPAPAAPSLPAASSLPVPAPPAAAPPEPPPLTPEQIAAQAAAAVLKKVGEARREGDQMVRDGHLSDALPAYLQALDGSEHYAALRSGDPGAEVETAKLCLIVGSLQANYASTAEARQTLREGCKILSKLKSGKSSSDDRAHTLNALQQQLRHLEDDGPRRRAQHD